MLFIPEVAKALLGDADLFIFDFNLSYRTQGFMSGTSVPHQYEVSGQYCCFVVFSTANSDLCPSQRCAIDLIVDTQSSSKASLQIAVFVRGFKWRVAKVVSF